MLDNALAPIEVLPEVVNAVVRVSV